MGRHTQVNARTLNHAVRRLFKPVITALPSVTVAGQHGGEPSAQTAGLISTQPDNVVAVDVDQGHASTTSVLGKRKIQEDAVEDILQTSAAYVQRSQVGLLESIDDKAIRRYTKQNLPPALRKYWSAISREKAQRYRLFSRYDEGVQMDYDGWFSVTPENVAAQIAERCRCDVVVDAFCGVGGNAIQFAAVCNKVIAIDTSLTRLECARANAEIYGLEENIEFIHADFVEWAKARAKDPKAEKIDVVFMSPPWGGIDYQQIDASVTEISQHDLSSDGIEGPNHYRLSSLTPLPGSQLFDLARSLTPNVAFYLPRNSDPAEIAALAEDETVELEELWMGEKLKALCVYYGTLPQTPAL